jgi:hypothetical protein
MVALLCNVMAIQWQASYAHKINMLLTTKMVSETQLNLDPRPS